MNRILNKLEQIHGKPKRILVVGTGGGSDLFSCLLVVAYIKRRWPNTKIDLAGMLSPAATHSYKDMSLSSKSTVENAVTFFDGLTTMSRKLNNRAETELTFVDNHLWTAIKHMGLEGAVENTYHLSCRYGSATLEYRFKDLCQSRCYDYVLGIDVGGDIIAPISSPTIMSPIMDWSCLHILKECGLPSYILEYGFGLDGESEGSFYQNISCVLPKLTKDAIQSMITTDAIDIYDGSAFGKFSKMFEEVMKPIRSGHTVPLFLETAIYPYFEGTKFDIPHTYKYRINGEETLTDSFVRKGVHHPCEVFLINTVMLIDKIPSGGFISPLEYAFWLKTVNKHIATEMDGQTDFMMDGGTVLMAALSHRLKQEDRDAYVKKAYELMGVGHDAFVLFDDDVKLLPKEAKLFDVVEKGYGIVGLTGCTLKDDCIHARRVI